jgi:hypothetical protein
LGPGGLQREAALGLAIVFAAVAYGAVALLFRKRLPLAGGAP